MFKEIIKKQEGPFVPESFSLEEERWKTKHEATDCHEVVINAELELINVDGFNWFRFSRNNLKDVWASDCSFSTKYIATLWWGHVFRQIFNDVYSPTNLDKLSRISTRLNNALTDAALTQDYEEFCEKH